MQILITIIMDLNKYINKRHIKAIEKFNAELQVDPIYDALNAAAASLEEAYELLV